MAAVTPALRARAYRLLGRALRRGLDTEVLEVLGVLGRRAEAGDDPDRRAAAHHRLLRREVLPYASVFLEESRTLGGAVTRQVEALFLRAGVDPPEGEAPDHLGSELELLAVLTERGDEEGVRSLLADHLLWWLPSWSSAFRRRAAGDPPWRDVAELVLSSVLDQAASLPAGPAGPPASGRMPPALAAGPLDPLDDPDAGIREVAAHLVTPLRSGLYLAPGDLRDAGRRGELPGGFGERARLAENLLRSAAHLGGMEVLAGGLEEVVEEENRALRAAVADGGLPEDFAGPWLRRLALTRVVLRRLGEAGPGGG